MSNLRRNARLAFCCTLFTGLIAHADEHASYLSDEGGGRTQTLIGQTSLIEARPTFLKPVAMMAGGTLSIGGGFGLGGLAFAMGILGNHELVWVCLVMAGMSGISAVVLIIAGVVSLVGIINARAATEVPPEALRRDRPLPNPSMMVGPAPNFRIASF